MIRNIGVNRNLFLTVNSNLGHHHVVPTTPEIAPEQLILTVIETQQLPDIGKADSREELFFQKCTNYNGRREIRKIFKVDADQLSFVLYR